MENSVEQNKLLAIAGIKFSAVAAGIKKINRLDLVLIELCEGANVAGAYTQNAFCAAPVVVAKQHNETMTPRYFIINTGNANAGTGEAGIVNAQTCCEAVAASAPIKHTVLTEQVLPFSTGVIGEALPADKIVAAIPQAFRSLSNHGWLEAARGIMTTDTCPKAFSEKIEVAGKTVSITGIAKGAGMIKPNMATMLGYIFTDAIIEQSLLKILLDQALQKSFNRITVDGDTSTNDCCMLVATGKSDIQIAVSDESVYQSFITALENVFTKLAQGLVKDAEGATKFVTIKVEAGLTASESLEVAYTIAESPLVKTALFASDPNWGRILAAVGRAKIKCLDVNAVAIYLGDVCIVQNGCVCATYTEEKGAKVMAQDDIIITVNLGRGEETEVIWTSDLSYDYVRINAEYRT